MDAGFSRCRLWFGKYFHGIECDCSGYIKSLVRSPLLTVLRITDLVVVAQPGEGVCRLAPQLLEFGERQAAMRQVVAKFAVVVTILASGIIPQAVVASQAQKTQTKKAEQQKKSEGASLTGCVDQQDGQFVLVDDHDLRVVASLDAEGYPVQGFAKHVGHKVTVRGINTSGDTRPVFKVRTIETVSETCAPQAPEGEKK
jgi:hypothetical protein